DNRHDISLLSESDQRADPLCTLATLDVIRRALTDQVLFHVFHSPARKSVVAGGGRSVRVPGRGANGSIRLGREAHGGAVDSVAAGRVAAAPQPGLTGWAGTTRVSTRRQPARHQPAERKRSAG